MTTAFCVHCGGELDPRRALCPRCAKPASPTVVGMPAMPIKTQPIEIHHEEQVMSELVPTMPRGATPQGVSRTVPMEAMAPLPIAGAPVTKSQAMTMIASEGLGLARSFNAMLGRPFPGWKAELLEPAGPSTGGGAQSMQHISIIGPAGNRLAIGRLDSVARLVQLRSYEMVQQIHQERFGHPFPITPDMYRQYLGITSHMLSGVGLVVQHEIPTPSILPPQPHAETEASKHNALWLLAVLGLAVMLALLIYWQM